MDLLEEVKKIQVERGLNDTQMSELLGYKHRTGWARIKSGIAPANEVFQMRALRAFPEIQKEEENPGILGKLKLIVKKYL